MPGIKVVVDTNVVISGIFWRGNPHKILMSWFREKFETLVSEPILEEYERVLKRLDSGLTPEEIQRWVEIIVIHSTFVKPFINIDFVRDDPDDNKFIECAVDGNADYIISGDKHLLNIKKYENIEILSPREFILRLGK